MYKGVELIITIFAKDKTSLAGRSLDGANISTVLIADGDFIGSTINRVVEVHPTAAPGIYTLLLTADEMNFKSITVIAKSTTSDVIIDPVMIHTISPEDVWASTVRSLTDKAGFSLNSDYDGVKNGAGDGRVEWNYQYTDDHGPVDGAYIKVYTEWDCINCVSGAYTDAFGFARFWLVPGKYYIVALKNGHDVFGPDEEVVE